MFYALLAFSFAVMSAIRCNPLGNLKSSENVQNKSTILETLSTFGDLDTIQFMCTNDESITGTYETIFYCDELIKENDNYSSLRHVIDIKFNEIRSSLIKLLNLEKKAIVCRSIRHLFPIIMYGIFINDIKGSTEKENSRMNMINKLLKKKLDFLNNKNSSIEEKLQQIEISMMKSGRTNKKLLSERPEQSEGEFVEISSSLLEKIKTTVQLILPFIQELDCFHNLYKIDKVMTTNKFDLNVLLLLILDEVKTMYKTECYFNVDAATVLQNGDGRWIIEPKYDSTPLLVGEIYGVSEVIQKDLQSLFVKFFFTNKHNKQFLPHFQEVSLIFFHTFNKYYDPNVWRLIGNENIVDYESDSAKPITTSIDKVALNLLKKIQGTMDGLTAFKKNRIRCRYCAYLNLMMKLNYCSLRVLAENVQEIQRFMNVESQKIEQGNIYNLLHDKINELEITKCSIGNDISSVSMIDELLDRDDDNQYFRSVYAKYWNQNAQIIAMAIEFLYDSLSLGFMEEEFRSMLREIYQIQAHLGSDMTFVEYLVKWART
ncbi:uncharacterized protein LOC132930839 [Rhopalosiphum padi]|uniref:uncharacterized protein LOC132930839 n=1 Tax=Rhopalosiphum padi TaxID=40932 RepID=UPI00298DE667|nr:uncharacterized protein LOC132930839 [Rhopalosiphum padi]